MSLVGVDRQAIVHMLADAMVPLARLPRRVDVDIHTAEMCQVVVELMPHFLRDGVSVSH